MTRAMMTWACLAAISLVPALAAGTPPPAVTQPTPEIPDWPEYRPGTITNMVVPGDPVQKLELAGFATAKEAQQFLQEGLQGGRPVLRATLQRGESAALGTATHVVFYYHEDDGRPTLLSLTRCHADLHLVAGFCGFQFLLTVNMPQPPAAEMIPR